MVSEQSCYPCQQNTRRSDWLGSMSGSRSKCHCPPCRHQPWQRCTSPAVMPSWGWCGERWYPEHQWGRAQLPGEVPVGCQRHKLMLKRGGPRPAACGGSFGDGGDAGDPLSGDLGEVQPDCGRDTDTAACGQRRWSTRVLQLGDTAGASAISRVSSVPRFPCLQNKQDNTQTL